MLEKKKDNFIPLIVTVLILISFFGQVLRLGIFTSLSFAVSIALILFVFFINIINNKIQSLDIIFYIFLCLCSIIVGLKVNADIIKNFLITISVFVCFRCEDCFNNNVSQFSKKIIAILFAVAIVVLNVFYYLGLNTTYYGTTNLVCLNFDNPNAAGLWLTAFFIVLGLSTSIFKSKVVKVVFWLLSFSLVPMINATGSRNSLLALIFFVVLYIIAFLVKAKKVNKAFVIFIIVLPIIVFFFYLFIFIPNSDFFNSIFGKGVFGDNKTLTTRAEIWTNCLNDFGKVWMFGDASVGFANLHNSLITLIFKNGILATIVGCIVIYRSLNDMQERGKILSTLALLAFLFTGCFEASFFGGVAGLYLFILIFCAVGKENDK